MSVELLQKTLQMMADLKPVKDARWQSDWEFVLRFGLIYEPQPLPEGYRHMLPGQCFLNASELARERNLIYVEGYCSLSDPIVPIHHAWCCEPTSRKVIDPTNRFAETCSYIGVPFRTEFVHEHQTNSSYFSLLDNYTDNHPMLHKSADGIRKLMAVAYEPGQKVEWLYQQRGGYGFSWWVPATVVNVGPKRVTIEAQLERGGSKRISVAPYRLRLKN